MSLDTYRTIARNLRRARLARGWKQAELGAALSEVTGRPWSVATVCQAERSAETDRVRRFDAGDLAAFARVFGVPIAYFTTKPGTPSSPEGPRCGHDPQTCLSVERERDYLRSEVDRLRALLDGGDR